MRLAMGNGKKGTKLFQYRMKQKPIWLGKQSVLLVSCNEAERCSRLHFCMPSSPIPVLFSSAVQVQDANAGKQLLFGDFLMHRLVRSNMDAVNAVSVGPHCAYLQSCHSNVVTIGVIAIKCTLEGYNPECRPECVLSIVIN